MALYSKTDLEHSLDGEVDKQVVVSLVGSAELGIPVARITGDGNIRNIAKYYIEEGKKVYILLEFSKFESSLKAAKDFGCGIIFECGTAFDNALKTSPIEIERLAGLNGITQNIARISAIYANSVPFSMSRKQAELEIKKCVLDQNEAAEAIENLGTIIQENVMSVARNNLISPRPTVKVREFGFNKFCEAGLEELRDEMRAAYAVGGIHLWKLPMGIGKTVVISELVELAAKNSEKPAYIAPRINISRAISEDVAKNYLSDGIAGCEHELDALSICVNSITRERFKVFLAQSGVVILEEVEQIIAHITKGACKNRVQVYNEIVNSIKKARLVVALDANANDEVIELLQQAGLDINVLQAKSDNSNIEVFFAEEIAIEKCILMAAEAKQKSIVMVEFPSQADVVKKIFDDQKLNSLVITAETRDFPEVTAFITNPNSEIVKYNGAIIYNSAMQSSTSIEIDWADHVFGMFKGVLRVNDMMQMMRRYRPAKKIMVSLRSDMRPVVFDEEINMQYNICEDDSKDFNSAALRVHKKVFGERKNIKHNFAAQVEHDGYRISYQEMGELDISSFAAFRNAAKEVRKETVARTIHLAHSGDIKSLNTGGKNFCQTHIDEKRIIEAANCIGLDIFSLNDLAPEDIKFFTSRSASRILNNARCWYQNSDFNEVAYADDLKLGIDKKYVRKRKEILNGFMNSLGVDAGGEGVADVGVAAKFVKANLRWIEVLGLITAKRVNFETSNQKHAVVNNVLESIGLSLKRHKFEGEFIYKLDNKKYHRMLRFLGLKYNIT